MDGSPKTYNVSRDVTAAAAAAATSNTCLHRRRRPGPPGVYVHVYVYVGVRSSRCQFDLLVTVADSFVDRRKTNVE